MCDAGWRTNISHRVYSRRLRLPDCRVAALFPIAAHATYSPLGGEETPHVAFGAGVINHLPLFCMRNGPVRRIVGASCALRAVAINTAA